MSDVVIMSTVLNLVFAVLAVVALVFLLRWFDKQAGVGFTEWIEAVSNENPKALAIYYGLRFLGVCLLVGAIIQ